MVVALPAHLLPKWEPTYDMSRSTIIQPCNWSGTMDSQWLAKWGVVSVDWSNARRQWAQAQPMDCDQMLLKQIKGIKEASNNTTKVFTYRNIVKALPWFGNVREKIVDPAYSGWFLKYTGNIQHDHYWNAPCQREQGCSVFYHDELSSPQDASSGEKPDPRKGWCNQTCDCGGLPCGEYLFDHRNSSLGDWLVEEFLLGDTALGSPFVDGYFLDDVWSGHGGWGCSLTSPFGGPSEMNGNCTIDMGLSATDIADITEAWHQNFVTAKAVAVGAGGFEWHLLEAVSSPVRGSLDECKAFFREACSPHSTAYDSALMVRFTYGSKPGYGAPYWQEDLATFLLIRGPFGWIGHDFSTCALDAERVGGPDQLYERPSALDADYGEPRGLCAEDGRDSGMFRRGWSNADVSYDCVTHTGKVIVRSQQNVD